MFRLIFIAITTLAIVVSSFMGFAVESRAIANHPEFGIWNRMEIYLTACIPALYFLLSFLAYEFWRRFRFLRIIIIAVHAMVLLGIVFMCFTPAGDVAGFILFLYAIFIVSFITAIRQRHYQQPILG